MDLAYSTIFPFFCCVQESNGLEFMSLNTLPRPFSPAPPPPFFCVCGVGGWGGVCVRACVGGWGAVLLYLCICLPSGGCCRGFTMFDVEWLVN